MLADVPAEEVVEAVGSEFHLAPSCQLALQLTSCKSVISVSLLHSLLTSQANTMFEDLQPSVKHEATERADMRAL